MYSHFPQQEFPFQAAAQVQALGSLYKQQA
jgi:hypothetical protein